MPFCFILAAGKKVDDVVFLNESQEVSYLTIIMFSFIIIRLFLMTNSVVIYIIYLFRMYID